MATTYQVFGRTYLADGWTGIGPLFSVLVPDGDDAHALDYGRRHSNHTPNGLQHGDHDVMSVQPVADTRHFRPRNARDDRPSFPIYLTPAPNRSLWQIQAVTYEAIRLQKIGGGETQGTTKTLTWAELREAALGSAWYGHLLSRAEAAAY